MTLVTRPGRAILVLLGAIAVLLLTSDPAAACTVVYQEGEPLLEPCPNTVPTTAAAVTSGLVAAGTALYALSNLSLGNFSAEAGSTPPLVTTADTAESDWALDWLSKQADADTLRKSVLSLEARPDDPADRTVSQLYEDAVAGLGLLMRKQGSQGNVRLFLHRRLKHGAYRLVPGLKLSGSRPVKFDDLRGDNKLIDAKWSVTGREKTLRQAIRQAAALRENKLQGVWQVPDRSAERDALRVLTNAEALDVISVEVMPAAWAQPSS